MDNLGAKLHGTMNAETWAFEFMKMFCERRNEIDEDLMRAWFANSIMCGYDHGQRKECKLYNENQKLKSLILLTDPAVSNIVVNDQALRQWNEFVKYEKENQ